MSVTRTSLSLQTLLDARLNAPSTTSSLPALLDQLPGQRTSKKRGQGIEFDDLRQYTPGDDVRHIDWNVTARTTEPYTRVYREERQHTITVVVDFRTSMFTGSESLLAVRAGQLAASVLWQASEVGDRGSAVVFTNDDIKATRPLGGYRGAVNACELIATEFSRASTIASAEPTLAELLMWLNKPRRNTAAHVMFSGLSNTGDALWQQALQVAAMKHHLLAVMLLDPLETSSLPTGRYTYQQGKTDRSIFLNKSAASKLRDLLQQDITRVSDELRAAGAPSLTVDASASASDMLAALRKQGVL